MVTKLPDAIDPAVVLKEQITNKYSKCPCCGESKGFVRYLKKGVTDKGVISCVYRSWYGKQYEGMEHSVFEFLKPKHWFEKCFHYRQDLYQCKSCGCKWETIPYPTNVVTQKDINFILNQLGEQDEY
jgi:hypothetical protein